MRWSGVRRSWAMSFVTSRTCSTSRSFSSSRRLKWMASSSNSSPPVRTATRPSLLPRQDRRDGVAHVLDATEEPAADHQADADRRSRATRPARRAPSSGARARAEPPRTRRCRRSASGRRPGARIRDGTSAPARRRRAALRAARAPCALRRAPLSATRARCPRCGWSCPARSGTRSPARRDLPRAGRPRRRARRCPPPSKASSSDWSSPRAAAAVPCRRADSVAQ